MAVSPKRVSWRNVSPRNSSPIRQYLDRYAEPIVSWFQTEFLPHVHRTYQFVLVVPAFDEPLKCLEQVLPSDLQQTLVIVVANSAEDSDPVAVARTQAFLKHYSIDQDAQALSPISRLSLPQESDGLIVDCTTDGRQLPAKQGVGLARKIGGDLALACIQQGLVQCPWIHCTDADVRLPLNYFDANPPSPDVAVAIYPFEHAPRHDAILFYEISLRYYVVQLAQAASPYAFQTIGSLLKINAHHYAVVRGFPKRKAAEDFYMLNKLAKTGHVLRLKEPAVQLASRISKRVPFGTGAAMERFAMYPQFELYHPQVFQHLGTWLKVIPALWGDRPSVEDLHQWWSESPLILETLLALGLEKVLPHAYHQCRDVEHFQRYLWGWFDAFKTLKFIHTLRDQAFPNLPILQAIAMMGLMPEVMLDSPLSTATLTNINTALTMIETQMPVQRL